MLGRRARSDLGPDLDRGERRFRFGLNVLWTGTSNAASRAARIFYPRVALDLVRVTGIQEQRCFIIKVRQAFASE